MNLSDNLKKIRKDNNLSQEQLAEKLGVSRQSVSKWESNLAYPEMDKVLQICQIFNLNVDELLNQNIKEVKEKRESKNNVNKYIDDFLNFVTKTIDLFSSMKFKDKVKCLFEQFLIGIFLLIFFFIIGSIGSFIIGNLFYVLPDEIYYLIFCILEAIYIFIAIIVGIVILLHIFRVRYLDYYVIVKNNKEETDKKEYDMQKEKIYLEKKEKIIIRDPNHCGYKFIKGLLRCVLFIIKVFTLGISLFLLLPLICLVIGLIISFLFIKTGILFIGVLLSIISTIVVNLLILYIIYNFIFSKKIKKNKVALIFITSILTFSLGVGLALTSIKDFNYINDTDSKYYVEEEKIINMNDNLLFDDGYHYYSYHYFDVEYIESNSNDVRISCKHSDNYTCNIDIYDNVIYIHNYQDDTNLMEQLREYIDNINNKEIVNYSNYKITVYTSKENIDKLIENKENYIKQRNEESKQEEIDYLSKLLDQKNNEIYELQDKIYELENYIYN